MPQHYYLLDTLVITIIPLFTLGSIYSTNVSGAEQMPKTNNLKDPEANQVDQFTSMAEDLSSELPRTNPASGQSGT